ncbi:MAG: hypothetical protein CL565_06400, partial [Alphaproteobacteria bacterium]|nr:hypothetical protein [Alphaproteobacteria bacterium]
SGSGIYVENGASCNTFLNCESNVSETAAACVLIGADSEATILMNLYTLSSNLVPNIQLEAGSTKTAISNLYAASNGAAIWDFSGGDYTASNAGYPFKNSMKATEISDLETGLQRFSHQYYDTTGTLDLDLNASVYFLSSYNGALITRLPDPGDFNGAEVMIKKIDNSTNTIRITDVSESGLDGHDVYLSAEHDYVVVISNGAEWFIMSANRTIGSNKYYDTTGTIQIDLAHDVYILSSYNGALTVQLPPADAAQSFGRTVTLKKTDTSSNPINITELGGGGPDQSSQTLNSRYEAVTVFSDGAQWYVISRL